MNNPKGEARERDLSPRASDLIRSELEDGLRRFREGDFEARLERRAREASRRTKPPSGRLRRAWIPALALGAAAAAVFLVGPRRSGPAPGAGAARIAEALSRQPGIRDFNPAPPPAAENPPSSPASETFARALALASRGESAGDGSPSLPSPWPGPFNLRQKMELLYRDRTIERALLIFAEKSQGGLT